MLHISPKVFLCIGLRFIPYLGFLVGIIGNPLNAQDLPPVTLVEAQPLKAQIRRLIESMEYLGNPFPPAELQELRTALAEANSAVAIASIQRILKSRVLLSVHINPESRVKVAAGPAPPQLMRHGWRLFLVRVHNEAGVTANLHVHSEQALPVFRSPSNAPEPVFTIGAEQIEDRWLDLQLADRSPFSRKLSGLELEYKVLYLYSRDAGKREATFAFDVGQGSQDLGFRNESSILFECKPAVKVRLNVRDVDGAPVMAAFEFLDHNGFIHPSPVKRLAPDFFFQLQIYRADGEDIFLTPGHYRVKYSRGPEYRVLEKQIHVPEGVEEHEESFQLERWIHLRKHNWYSGDHHVHAAGCAHYEDPTAGVLPEDMFRHQLGEDLNVACLLSWGPCWYFQKKFFEGEVHELSQPNYLMRYDVEVSGFPSQHAGHLCLLRLKEDDYPGTERIEDWPSWDLPILQWAKEQGGVVGFSHSGWGLHVQSDQLPNYEIPPFDSIGANEYIVDVTHDAVDFISTVDTPYVWELNIWYHTLNCGFRTRISGETDFPCIYGERIGMGRVYCKLENGLNFDAFCDALRDGRSYVSDGSSHLFDFSLNGTEVGVGHGEVHLKKPGPVVIQAKVAALLDEVPHPQIRQRPYWEKPYWHIERCRLGDSRKVPVELIVNGKSVDRLEIEANGSIQDIQFQTEIPHSSWVALRILPSSHTNPIFVLVDKQPIRASRRSAQWCLDSVDQCWKSKEIRIRSSEIEAAKDAYQHARVTYQKILEECTAD